MDAVGQEGTGELVPTRLAVSTRNSCGCVNTDLLQVGLNGLVAKS